MDLLYSEAFHSSKNSLQLFWEREITSRKKMIYVKNSNLSFKTKINSIGPRYDPTGHSPPGLQKTFNGPCACNFYLQILNISNKTYCLFIVTKIILKKKRHRNWVLDLYLEYKSKSTLRSDWGPGLLGLKNEISLDVFLNYALLVNQIKGHKY